MNIKSEKGLSMIAVIIVLVVMIVTVIETIIIAKKWTQEANAEDLATTMLLIQARCKTYKDKETIEDDDKKKEDLKGKLISEVKDNQLIKNLIEKNVIKEDDKYYFLSVADLQDLHIYTIDPGQVFLVNYDTEEVIYANGIEKNGNILYKLSEIKGNTEETNNKNSETNNDVANAEKDNTNETKAENKQKDDNKNKTK